MSVNQKSNFNIVGFFIADYPPVSNNQVLYVNYIEDIRSATMLMDVQITDTESGFLSQLTGMENVFLVIDDSEGRTQLGGDFVIYDIQDRKNISGKSSAVIRLCRNDFLNNAANKVSRRFGKGEGKKIHDIVKKEILQDLIGVRDEKLNEFEPCVNNFSFVSPYWNPFTAIRWLAAKSIPAAKGSSKAASAGYAFYETRAGYNFVSYDSFATKEPVIRMVVGHDAARYNTGSNNTIIGQAAGDAAGDGTDNVFIGKNSGGLVTNLSLIHI